MSNPYGAARGDTVGIPLPGVLVRLAGGEINEGHLVIRGRTKELIITGGRNVYPREVELALERHPAVREAAVAGVPHEHWGEQVTAWVVLRDEAAADQLIKHTRSLLASYKCPKEVFFLDAVPRNHLGKVARSLLTTPAARAHGAFVELYPQENGTPVAVKDLVDIAGQTVRNGTPGLGHRVAAEDAEVWTKLRATGHFPIGRTRVPELAWSVRTPGCRNPWDPRRDAGGSSGGSAVAVAAGVVRIALGTDTGGSIRIPAALCGVAGLRPTHGTVSTKGVTPMAPSMDTVGPIALTASDCLRLHEILGGAVESAPPVAGLRIGLPAHLWGDKVDPEVLRLLEAAAETLRAAGAKLVDIELPLARRHARGAGYTIMLAESAQEWWAAYQQNPAGLAGRAAEMLRAGSQVTDYQQALAHAAAARAELDEAFGEVNVLLLPTVPVTAAPADAGTVELGGRAEPIESAYYRLTALASVTGHPALTVPAGLSAEGLPVGAQLVGPRRQEALLCRLGETVENGPASRELAEARERFRL